MDKLKPWIVLTNLGSYTAGVLSGMAIQKLWAPPKLWLFLNIIIDWILYDFINFYWEKENKK